MEKQSKSWLSKHCDFMRQTPMTPQLPPEEPEEAPQEAVEAPLEQEPPAEAPLGPEVPEEAPGAPDEALEPVSTENLESEIQNDMDEIGEMIESVEAGEEPVEEILDPEQPAEEGLRNEGFEFDVNKCDRVVPDAYTAAVSQKVLDSYHRTGFLRPTGNEMVDDIVQTELELMGTDTLPTAASPALSPSYAVEWASRPGLPTRTAARPGQMVPGEDPREARMEELRLEVSDLKDKMSALVAKATGPRRKKDPKYLSGKDLETYEQVKKRYYYLKGQHEGVRMDVASNLRERLLESKKTNQPTAEIGAQIVRQLVKTPKKLLGSNTKLEKGEKFKYMSAGLSLAPATVSGLGSDLCPFKSRLCFRGCLADSGQGEYFPGTYMGQDTRQARFRRTWLYLKAPDAFYPALEESILKHAEDAKAAGMKFSARLNVLSDQPWEDKRFDFGNGKQTLFERLPKDIQLYDYTKNPDRFVKYLLQNQRGQDMDWPENYHLTMSLSEINMAMALWALENGGNVAMVFDTPGNQETTPVHSHRLLPKWALGHKVIDADMFDMRFLDKKFFSATKSAKDPFVMSRGIFNTKDTRDVRQQVRDGKGLIAGLRIKGRKFMQEVASEKAEEREQGLPFGELTGGFVHYSDEAGMGPKHRTYNHAANMLNDPEKILDMLALSERRRLEQKFKGGEEHGKKLRFSAIGDFSRGIVYPELIEALGKRYGSRFRSGLEKRVPTLFKKKDEKAHLARMAQNWVQSVCKFT